MNVLQIDDSKEICGVYADMFEADNHSFNSVNDTKEGLELVKKNDYDLILLDMCMPKYDGIDFLHDLKKQRPSELKKVVITSVLQFNESQVKKLMEFGIHAVEEKPTDFKQLESLQRNIWMR